MACIGWSYAQFWGLNLLNTLSLTWHLVDYKSTWLSVNFECDRSANLLAVLPARHCGVSALNIKLLEPLAQGASRFEKLLAPRKIYWPPFSPDRRLYSWLITHNEDKVVRNSLRKNVSGQGSQKLYNWPKILSPPHYRNGVHHTVEIICLYCGELRDVSENI